MPKNIREVVVTYNKAAPLYDLMNQVYFFGRDKGFRSMLVERLNLKPGDAVLNLCCGTGLDFPFLLQKIKNQGTLLGVDLSFEMLQQAKKKIVSEGVNLVRSDAAHLAFRDKTFDAILASFCLEITPTYKKAIEEAGRFLKMIKTDGKGKFSKDQTVDSSVYGIFEFGVLPADDPRVEKTMKTVESLLWVKTEVGGIARYQNDYYHQVSKDVEKVPGNPWHICTLWLAEWYIAKAKSMEDLKKGETLLQWVADHALESGVLAEQINPYNNQPLSVSPLTWSHSTFVLAVIEYLNKLNEFKLCKACGLPMYRKRSKKLW